LYIKNDYAANLQILERMYDGLWDAGYRSGDAELDIIVELAHEYQNKWETAIANVIADLAAKTLENIATRNPVMSIASAASTLINWSLELNAKMEVYALGGYRDALLKCLSPIDVLYRDGLITSDITSMKQFVSLYLGVMERSNELSIKVANSLVNDLFFEDMRQEDLATLNEQLTFIRSLQKLYAK